MWRRRCGSYYRELMFGGRRFSDLRASLPGISAKILTERLAGLEAAGVVRHRTICSVEKREIKFPETSRSDGLALERIRRFRSAVFGHSPSRTTSDGSGGR